MHPNAEGTAAANAASPKLAENASTEGRVVVPDTILQHGLVPVREHGETDHGRTVARLGARMGRGDAIAQALHLARAGAGETSMGRAVLTALDMRAARKAPYRRNGVAWDLPWALQITDGAPTDSITEAARRVREAEELKKLAFFAIGVDGADVNLLRQLAVREPLRLKGLAFRELFQWLSASLSSVSRSRPGDSVPLPPPSGWAAI